MTTPADLTRLLAERIQADPAAPGGDRSRLVMIYQGVALVREVDPKGEIPSAVLQSFFDQLVREGAMP